MSEQQGRQSQSHGNGHGGLYDGDEDYDGGLRAAAEGGRVAVFRGAGRPAQPAPEVDSPFLGLFDDPGRRARAPEPAPPVSANPVSAPPISAPPTATPEDLRVPARNGYDVRRSLERAPYNGSVRSNGTAAAPLVAAPVDEAALVPVREAPLVVPAPPDRRPAERKPAKKPPKKTPLDKTPKPKTKDRDPSIDLQITEIAGHLTFTANTVTAWYWLPEVRWAFRPDAEREALLSAISEQYAGLAGFRLHLRRTTRPFPADEWARVVDANTPFPLPAVPGAAVLVRPSGRGPAAPAVGQPRRGTDLPRHHLRPPHPRRHVRRADRRIFGRGVGRRRAQADGRTVEQFDEVLGAFGMRGRRVTAAELEWLLYRSVALCMSPPGPALTGHHGQWDTGDLLALTEQIERYRTPYGSTVKLVNRLTGEERHVAVLSVGRMEPLEIPERHEPWLHFHERLPWPMEISSRVDILGPNDSFKNLEHRLRMIRSQQADYAEHGIDAPPELERLAKRALDIGDEMTTGLPVDSSRAHGWHRIAVGGRTREECLERARRLIQLYSRELRVSLQHPKNQDWLAREFIPGEPIANTGYLRRMPVKLFAAGAAAGGVDRRRPARRPDRAYGRHLPPAGLPRPALPDGGPGTLRPRPSSWPSRAVASRP